MAAGSFIPGLPDSLRNTYRDYKTTCSIITRWVHETVARIRLDLAHAQAASTPGNKSKPKAQQSRNSRKQHPKPVADDLSTPSHSFSAFLKQVRELAASDVAIPRVYIEMLSIMIRQRKATAAFYSTDADAWRKNETHKKAIELYQDALDILEHAYRGRGGSEEAFALGIRDDVHELTAAMRRLALVAQEEEAASPPDEDGENEWIRDNPMLHPSGTKSKRKTKTFPLEAYELYPDNMQPPEGGNKIGDADDAWLALQYFILDVDGIRRYITTLWETVTPSGDTSRFTASFVTNHAVHLVKQLEYDLVIDFPQYKDIDTTQRMLITTFAEELINAEKAYFVKERLMTLTWLTLKTFGEVLDQPGLQHPVMKDGHFGYFNPKVTRQSLSLDERIREDKCILCNHWPDLIIMYKHTKFLPRDGRFLGDFGLPREFGPFLFDPSRPKSWTLLFSCQVMLDVVHARRLHLQEDVDAMRSLGRKLSGGIDAFLSDGVTYDTNISEVQAVAPTSSREIKAFLLHDFLTLIKVKNGWDKLSKQACQKDSLWLYNPWLTANAMTDALMDSFMVSVDAMGGAGFVQSAMHLWNTIKQMGHLPEAESSDAVIDPKTPPQNKHILLMDYLIDIFGTKVFSGPPPTDRFLARFELMLGVRPEEFAAGKQKQKKNSTRSEMRNQSYNKAGRGVTPLASRAWDLHTHGFVLLEKNTKMGKAAAKGESPIGSLAYVQALIESEIGQSPEQGINPERVVTGPFINLDIFKIHQLCVRLFTELHEGLQEEFARVFHRSMEELIPTQIQWPMITGWILRSGELTSGGLNQQLLQKAGEIVGKIVGTKEVMFYIISDN